MLDEEEKGEFLREEKRSLVTWVFEEGTFVPTAKLTNQQKLSIATNYMGTPEAMYREDGEAVWKCELSSYGKVRKFQGEFKTDCPFRYQGQYEDSETGLYYNRFRYYSPDEGVYINQDPIRLNGGITLYAYVHNPNAWVDKFGLESCDELEDKYKDLQPGDTYPDWEGPLDYKEIDPRRPDAGKDFTKSTKDRIYDKNRSEHNGYLVSDANGIVLATPTKSVSGERPSPYEAQLDHKFPKSEGGRNDGANAQVLSRQQNREKSNKIP